MKRGWKRISEAMPQLTHWHDAALMWMAFVFVTPPILVFFGMLATGEGAGALLIAGIAFCGFCAGVITSLDMKVGT